MATSEICSICKNPKSADSSGSLTQWINLCSCDLLPEEGEDLIEVQICGLCGKRIAEGRAGSFTQFIFRTDKCECPEPQPRREKLRLEEEKTVEIIENLEEEVELTLENKAFPLERYKPLAHLGEGVSGSVYLARDRLLNKKVALKVLTYFDPEKLVSFQDEARATSKMKHETIVALLDFGITKNNTPYMVMEYLQGETLESVLSREKRLDLSTCQKLFGQLASGLALAHKKEIFHRDLNLRNFILIPQGDSFQVKIIDFGLASWRKPDGGQSDENQTNLVGTPLFMSPDQGLGKPYDARSEIYSLACILYNCLTGEPPFVGETAIQTLSMHAADIPPSLEERTGIKFPSDLESFIQKALAKNPSERFQTMDEFKEALQAIEETVEPESTPGKPPKPGSSIDKNLIFVPLFILVFVAGAGAVWQQFQNSKGKYTPANHQIDKVVESEDIPELNEVEKSAQELGYTDKKWVYENRIMRGVEVTDDDFEGLELPKDCRFLNILGGSMGVSGSGLKHLAGQKLQRFQTTSGAFSDEGAYNLTRLEGLKTINIQYTEKLTKEGVKHLLSIPTLVDLQLRFMAIPEGCTELIAKNDQLYELNFGHCKRLTKQDLINVAKCKSIKDLRLPDVDLVDSMIEPITTMKLERLEIHENPTTDKGLIMLTKIKTLRMLKVSRGDGITRGGIDQFKNLNPKCGVREMVGRLLP